jgi:hypothetical protein
MSNIILNAMTLGITENNRLLVGDGMETKVINGLTACSLPLLLWRCNELRTDDRGLT